MILLSSSYTLFIIGFFSRFLHFSDALSDPSIDIICLSSNQWATLSILKHKFFAINFFTLVEYHPGVPGYRNFAFCTLITA